MAVVLMCLLEALGFAFAAGCTCVFLFSVVVRIKGL